MLRVTQETKAVMQCEKGRVIGFIKSTEPGKISVAVPGDRAVMTPAQARTFAAWLTEEADKVGRVGMSARTEAAWRTAEAGRQEALRAALDGTYRATGRRTY
ncbi:hypothetical protein ACIPT3_02315 [Streptomyces diastaticus]|uniref:hypothetical protein n=1 Tax=Streptomyces diastaticus TaxID=1956 RepID=UPI0037F354BD